MGKNIFKLELGQIYCIDIIRIYELNNLDSMHVTIVENQSEFNVCSVKKLKFKGFFTSQENKIYC